MKHYHCPHECDKPQPVRRCTDAAPTLLPLCGRCLAEGGDEAECTPDSSQSDRRIAVSLLVFVVAMLVMFAGGCIVGETDGPSPVDAATYQAQCKAAGVAYVRELGASASTIADEIRSGKIKTNAEAFNRFNVLTTKAKEGFNSQWGEAADKRNPPGGKVDAAAWDEAAKGWGSVR